MTEEELAEIRKRADRLRDYLESAEYREASISERNPDWVDGGLVNLTLDDVPVLLAEVERLRAREAKTGMWLRNMASEMDGVVNGRGPNNIVSKVLASWSETLKRLAKEGE